MLDKEDDGEEEGKGRKTLMSRRQMNMMTMKKRTMMSHSLLDCMVATL